MADPVIQQPSITLSKTIGGFYRVILHGPDNLQSQSDRPRFCEMDIASSWDKDDALDQAAEWFKGLRDKTPDEDSHK